MIDKETKNNTVDKSNIPNHVVIIMDGNGRWAKQKNLSRLAGHKEGMKSASSVVKAAKDLGIKYITLYAFSAQNWNRPKEEVLALMSLLKHFLLTLLLAMVLLVLYISVTLPLTFLIYFLIFIPSN